MGRLRNVLMLLVVVGVTYQFFGLIVQALLPWIMAAFVLVAVFGALANRMGRW